MRTQEDLRQQQATQRQLELDLIEAQERLNRCANEAATRTLVNTDRSEAELNGIRATPTFIIGPTIGPGRHRGCRSD